MEARTGPPVALQNMYRPSSSVSVYVKLPVPMAAGVQVQVPSPLLTNVPLLPALRLVILVSALAVVILGLYPGPLVDTALRAAAPLF